MVRAIRIEYEGAVYHVTIRGNDRKALFSTDVGRAALYRRTRNSLLRSVAAKYLCQWSGCTQREVGEILRIGNSPSVSKRLKRFNMLLETDKYAKRIQSEIEGILSKKE